MGKKSTSTIENRVYLFKDLGAAFLSAHGAGLASANAAERARTLRALGDIAHAACVLADTEKLDPAAVGKRIAEERAPAPAKKAATKKAPAKKAPAKKRVRKKKR